jgi:hypothetical protein
VHLDPVVEKSNVSHQIQRSALPARDESIDDAPANPGAEATAPEQCELQGAEREERPGVGSTAGKTLNCVSAVASRPPAESTPADPCDVQRPASALVAT